MRRRAQDQSNAGIPEETSDRSDECESTTQPAGELDNDADQSRTDQNDTLSRLSSELASPAEQLTEDVGKADQEIQVRISQACETETDCESQREGARQLYEKSLNLSERDSEICLSTASRPQGRHPKGSNLRVPLFRTWLRDSDRKEGTPTKANPRFPESPRQVRAREQTSRGLEPATAGPDANWPDDATLDVPVPRVTSPRRHARRRPDATHDVSATPRQTSLQHV
ncbi:unnamed protein product [Plutella xylostella]|uniref:(diamondback moth) hypothetical protein n=1 Tax=Plutella xylostella TaxID=51655 RepID=A0A8S4F6C6_PLUXY|nr:unnamed protein product [Plutella xylostella]